MWRPGSLAPGPRPPDDHSTRVDSGGDHARCVRSPVSRQSTCAGHDVPRCPHLPAAPARLDWKHLHAFRAAQRGPEFYFACLEYAQSLWQRRLAARALLSLDRALGADVTGAEPVVRSWPLPYRAMAWIIGNTPADVFIGNPRVHFQHYADRMNEPRRAQRQARAWACWALTRVVRPELPGDPRHRVHEPATAEIAAMLDAHGIPGERHLWEDVLREGAG